jgi:hypothetical protein
MKNTQIGWLFLVGISISLAGCIHHEETRYEDVPRAKVEFENDRAARVFYEVLSRKSSSREQSHSETEVSIPLVFEHKQRVIPGENRTFNDAVMRCDTNRDGVITESEADIYAQLRRKR